MCKIEDEIIQKPRTPMTLKEFLLKEFLDQDDVITFYYLNEDSNDHEDVEKEKLESKKLTCSPYTIKICFTDEDLLLRSKLHNQPLFVQGYINEQKVNRILIDDGSAVNILPFKILKDLSIPMDELMKSHLTI